MSDELLGRARVALPGLKDAALLDRALSALCAEHRAAEIDRLYEVFEALPLETEDQWGNLSGFLDAAGAA